jgi:hypothetical protein
VRVESGTPSPTKQKVIGACLLELAILPKASACVGEVRE